MNQRLVRDAVPVIASSLDLAVCVDRFVVVERATAGEVIARARLERVGIRDMNDLGVLRIGMPRAHDGAAVRCGGARVLRA